MRETAMIWWNTLSFTQKWEQIVKNKEIITGYPHRMADTLTGNEIEKIYQNTM